MIIRRRIQHVPSGGGLIMIHLVQSILTMSCVASTSVPYAPTWMTNTGAVTHYVIHQQPTQQQYLTPYIDNQSYQQQQQDQPSCASQNLPCSGYSEQSCQSYCTSQGYMYSTCDGPCCMCSLSPFSSSMPVASSVNGKVRETQQPFDWNVDLDAQESINPYTVYSTKGSSKSKYSSKTDYDNNNNIVPKNSNKSLFPSHQNAVCKTDACHQAANRMLSSINRNVNPCDDFYEFACGGFLQKTKIPSDQAEVTRFTALRNHVAVQLKTILNEPVQPNDSWSSRLVKSFYKSCMNSGLIEKLGFKPIKKVLEVLGGWPVVTGPNWQPQYFTWSNYVAWFRELGFSHDYFMKISVEPDIQNVNRKLITIGEPILSFTREVLIQRRSDPSIKAYYKYMVETAVLLGATRQNAQYEMSQALDFEIALAKSLYRPGKDSRASSYYNPITIAQLEAKYPEIPWLDMFQRLFPSGVKITSAEVVMLSAPQYVEAFINLIARTDIRVVSNYAVWRVVSSSIAYLPESARKLQFEFSASITGQKSRPPRWKECVDITSASLGNAVGAMYVRKYFSSAAKHQATEMLTDIHQSFLQLLEETDWMDAATKAKAKEKARHIRIHVGYPEEHMSDAKLTSLYSGYSFKDTEYFENSRNLVKAAVNLAFGKLKVPTNKNDWVTHGKTATVNAFYLPLENSIQFPAGILQSPFFDIARPMYMNYGSIGWIAGHELTHGFDDQGHQFDRSGNYFNWWDPFTKNTYMTKTQCIIKQYGQYSPTGSGIKLNGVNSQGENVADNGGVKAAYRGYQSWVRRNGQEKILPGLEKFTPNQLFWVSAAHNWCATHRRESLKHQLLGGVHSPGEFRVKGTFSNNKDFSRDFNCPVGSPMNPQNKCSVW